MTKIKYDAVKKPSGSRLQGINISLGEEVLHFRPQAICAGAVTFPAVLMSSPTRFMENFSDDDNKAIFEVYKTIAEIRDSPGLSNESIFTLDECMITFFDIVRKERIEAWGADNDEYTSPPSLDNIAPMRDGSITHSCSRDEYTDLCILSTLLKMLIPFQDVSAAIAEYIPNLISDHWSLFAMLDSAGGISEYPAYQLLISKTHAMAESKLGKGVPTGLTAKGVGEEDFIKIILIPKMFRDITRLETEVEKFENGINNNLSFKVNMAIGNYIDHDISRLYRFNTTQGAPRQDEDGGNTTRQEIKAGGERVSSIYGLYYTRDYSDIVNVTATSTDFKEHLKIPAEEVEALAAKYPSKSIWTSPQYSIIGFIFDKVIPIDAEEFCPPSAKVTMLAYSALIADKLNLPNLATLMRCQVDTEGQLTESETRNSVMTGPIDNPLLEEVAAYYPNGEAGNPFKESMDYIVKGIIRTNYAVAVGTDTHRLGEEWFPRLINDVGIKDEIVTLTAHILGVTNGN